jgi:hypothetical protein
MKRFILSAILLSFLALGVHPDISEAKTKQKKRHHKVHKMAARVNAVGATPLYSGSMIFPMGVSDDPMRVEPMGVVVHPGDCDVDCIQPTAETMTPANSYLCPSLDPAMCSVSMSSVMNTTDLNLTTLSDTASTGFNDYYYKYIPPKVVTIGGFSVPVEGKWQYYSIFKGRNGAPLTVHNTKGMDATRGFGVSPRPDNPPTSFGPDNRQAETTPER